MISAQAGWAWGQLASDGYVGYVPAGALRTPGPSSTHKVSVLRTFVYPGPLVHANAHHMAVAIEPTAEAIVRIRASGNEVTSARRLAVLR